MKADLVTDKITQTCVRVEIGLVQPVYKRCQTTLSGWVHLKVASDEEFACHDECRR